MKKQEEKKHQVEYFTFEKTGDTVSGKLNGFCKTQFGVVASIGKYSVNINKVTLLKIFREYKNIIKAGKEISIKYVKQVPVKNSKSSKVKIFEVVYDGNILEVSSDFELVESLNDSKFSDIFN
jgi:hypothetical protein